MIRGVNDGSIAPLGVTLDDRGADIAALSAHATAMDLRLLNETGSVEFARQRLPAHTGNVCHGCHSARAPDTHWHAKLSIRQLLKGSHLDAYSHLDARASRTWCGRSD